MPERLVFRHGQRRVVLELAAWLGSIVLIAFLAHARPQWTSELFLLGLLSSLSVVDDLRRPLYVFDDEGILLERTRGRLRPVILLLWTSIVDARRLGEGEIALGLKDGSWRKLPIGSLSEDDKVRFIEALKCSALKLGPAVDLGRWV